MPSSNVATSTAAEPVDRLALNVDCLRTGAASDIRPAANQYVSTCFNAGDE